MTNFTMLHKDYKKDLEERVIKCLDEMNEWLQDMKEGE